MRHKLVGKLTNSMNSATCTETARCYSLALAFMCAEEADVMDVVLACRLLDAVQHDEGLKLVCIKFRYL